MLQLRATAQRSKASESVAVDSAERNDFVILLEVVICHLFPEIVVLVDMMIVQGDALLAEPMGRPHGTPGVCGTQFEDHWR
ncbi:hypothetical protein TNCV_3645691 [Trichonephila clavipes]|nr:hypothetical protein TNCV_3645691 [Trichonephila clavipes]